MKLLPSGERAVLVEVADLGEVLALAEPVRALVGVVDVVPGERTLLVTVAEPADLASVRAALGGVVATPAETATTRRDPGDL